MAEGASAGAILLSLIGEDEAAALVGELSPDEVAALCGSMEALGHVEEADIDAVLTGFIGIARARNPVASAGAAPVRRAIERSLGPGRARTLMKPEPEAEHPVFAQLAWLSSDQVAELVADEHPQIAAIVLARVEASAAAAALAPLPDDERADLLHRVALLEPVGRAALDALADAIAALGGAEIEARIDVGGTARVAAILNRADRPLADRTLKALSRLDKGLASRIDEARVTFADVVALPDKDLGTVVRSCEAAVLARALKGVDAATRDRMLGAMSARGAQSLRDDIDELTGVSKVEVEGAQAAIVAIARALSDDGSVRMGGGGVDYV